MVPVTQSAYMQRNKLKYLMEKIDRLLGISDKDRSKKWTVQSKGCGRGVIWVWSESDMGVVGE